MVAIRFSALAALALAVQLNALLFSNAPHRGAVRRLANANPVPAAVEGGLDYYRGLSSKAKRAGPGKNRHCAAKQQASTAANSQATPSGNSDEVDTVADVTTTTTTKTPVPTTTTRARTTTTRKTTTKTTTTTTAKATTTTAASSGSSSSSDDGLSDSQQATFLSLHNSIRSEHGATALTWSGDLAAAAKGWADKCVFKHSGGSLGPYGENLAAGTGKDYSSSNPVPSHYTQVVWKGTKQVGCALAPACSGIFDASYGTAKYFVCEYFPAGNVIGQFAANVQ